MTEQLGARAPPSPWPPRSRCATPSTSAAATRLREGALRQLRHRGGDGRGEGLARLHRAPQDRQGRGRLPRPVRLRRGQPDVEARELGQTPTAPPACPVAHGTPASARTTSSSSRSTIRSERSRSSTSTGRDRLRAARPDAAPCRTAARRRGVRGSDARVDYRERRAPRLRRGDHLPLGVRRRAGLVRHHAGPDGAGQGHRRRLPGRRDRSAAPT